VAMIINFSDCLIFRQRHQWIVLMGFFMRIVNLFVSARRLPGFCYSRCLPVNNSLPTPGPSRRASSEARSSQTSFTRVSLVDAPRLSITRARRRPIQSLMRPRARRLAPSGRVANLLTLPGDQDTRCADPSVWPDPQAPYACPVSARDGPVRAVCPPFLGNSRRRKYSRRRC